MSRSRPLWLICALGFLAFFSYDLIRSPLLPMFAESLGASPAWIGVVVGASTMTGVIVKLPAGAISDHLGRHRFLLAGLLVFAVAPLGYLMVKGLWSLIGLRFFHGLATGIFAPVSMAVVVDHFRSNRAEALGWFTALTQAGRLLGRMAGGYLLVWFAFRDVFLISFMVGLVAVVLYFRITPTLQNRGEEDRAKRLTRKTLARGMKEVVEDSSVLTTSGMEAVLMMASGTLMAFLPLYALSVGLNPGQAGLLFGIQGISSIGAKPIMGRLSDHIGRRPMIIWGQVICAAVIALFPWVDTLWGLALLTVVFGFGEAVIGSSTSALVADLCRERSYGSAMGVFGTIMDIGHASGPILSGGLIALFGYRGAFSLVGFALLIMTGVFVTHVKGVKP